MVAASTESMLLKYFVSMRFSTPEKSLLPYSVSVILPYLPFFCWAVQVKLFFDKRIFFSKIEANISIVCNNTMLKCRDD